MFHLSLVMSYGMCLLHSELGELLGELGGQFGWCPIEELVIWIATMLGGSLLLSIRIILLLDEAGDGTVSFEEVGRVGQPILVFVLVIIILFVIVLVLVPFLITVVVFIFVIELIPILGSSCC